MSCAGRGICGCGAPPCIENAWWFAFGGLWWLVAFEICERIRARDAITDAEIDFAREQQQHERE